MARWIKGFEKIRVDLKIFTRLFQTGIRRFGVSGFFSEFKKYLGDDRNFFSGSGNRYLERNGEIYIASAMPPVNTEVFYNYFIEEIRTLNRNQFCPLAFVLFSVSSRCPYKCKHCYAANELGKDEKLDKETIIKVLHGLARIKVPSVFFTGGEPMLRAEELTEVFESCSNLGLAYWIVTTGWNVDYSYLKNLIRYNLKGIVISLDSTGEKDVVESKGHPQAYKIALNAIEAAKKAGLVINVDCMVNYGPLLTWDGFFEYMEFTRKLGVHFVNFFPPVAIGGAKEHNLKILKTDEFLQLEELMERYNNLKGDRPLAYSAVVWEYRRGCIGGQQFININPAGDVFPCPFLQHSEGNVLETPIEEIIHRLRNRGESYGCFLAYDGLESKRRTDT